MTSLREKMKQEMTLRGLASGTQEHYLRAIIKLHDHYSRSPAKLSEDEIKSFLLFVISNQPCAASTYNVMIHGLKFFYEVVLNKKMVAINLPRKKEPQKLPDILSQSEVARIIKATLNLKHRTIVILIYGAGLRASEVGSLCVKDIDSERSVIHIREGKGKKDRYVMLSPFMLISLRTYWRECRLQPSKDKESNQDREKFYFSWSVRKRFIRNQHRSNLQALKKLGRHQKTRRSPCAKACLCHAFPRIWCRFICYQAAAWSCQHYINSTLFAHDRQNAAVNSVPR